jgi:hypothetical protein
MSTPALEKPSAAGPAEGEPAGAAAPPPPDKRNAPRLDLERPVQIIVGDAPPIPCSLSDVSKSGARVMVADPAAVPDEFELLLKNDLRKWCKVMRRAEKHVGIKFVAPPQPAPSVVPADAPAEATAKTPTDTQPA